MLLTSLTTRVSLSCPFRKVPLKFHDVTEACGKLLLLPKRKWLAWFSNPWPHTPPSFTIVIWYDNDHIMQPNCFAWFYSVFIARVQSFLYISYQSLWDGEGSLKSCGPVVLGSCFLPVIIFQFYHFPINFDCFRTVIVPIIFSIKIQKLSFVIKFYKLTINQEFSKCADHGIPKAKSFSLIQIQVIVTSNFRNISVDYSSIKKPMPTATSTTNRHTPLNARIIFLFHSSFAFAVYAQTTEISSANPKRWPSFSLTLTTLLPLFIMPSNKYLMLPELPHYDRNLQASLPTPEYPSSLPNTSD